MKRFVSNQLILFAGLASFGAIMPAEANTITVNSNADTGSAAVCVLRDAITAANTNTAVNGCIAGQASPTFDTIQFNLGSSALTISPASPMPDIIEPVLIDGYTQSGAAANTLASGSNATLKVVLEGVNSVASVSQTNYGFTIDALGSGSTIRGMVIDDFGTGGIHIYASSGNHITGNFIGVNAAGTAAKGNGGSEYRAGVYITATAAGQFASNNVVGGTDPADRNLISANLGGGVTLDAYLGGVADGNQIVGNLIGTNKAGTATVPNPNGGSAGVAVNEGVTNTLIGSPTGTTPGGACSGGCNLISGNYGQVNISQLSSATSTTRVQSNMIGPNLAGTAVPSGTIPNAAGIVVTSSAGTIIIGGTTAASRNVIAGNNNGDGIQIENYAASATVAIQGNYIGTNAAGTAALPNTQSGIEIDDTDGVTIGGTVAGAGNLISGNTYYGVYLGGAQNTLVQGNFIGTASDGVSDLANGRDGVRLQYGNAQPPNNNTIGASTSGGAGGNTIWYNGEQSGFTSGGVVISYGSGNRISSNSIFSNTGDPTGLGIDLGVDGVTTNQAPCTAGVGANNLQNYPDDIGFSTTAGVTHVSGTLAAAASTTYTIEFYSSPSADPSGYGQGKTYIGSTTVTTSAAPNCSVSFNATTAVPASVMGVVSAIAIDPSGNTSEFSQALDRIFANGFDGD